MNLCRLAFLAGTLLQPLLLLLLLLPLMSLHGAQAAPQQQKSPHVASQDACMMDLRRRFTGKPNPRWTDVGERFQMTKGGIAGAASWLNAQLLGRMWEIERGNTDAGFCVTPNTLRRLAVPADASLRQAVERLSQRQRQVYQQCFNDKYKVCVPIPNFFFRSVTGSALALLFLAFLSL
jgi:hypothetical protein